MLTSDRLDKWIEAVGEEAANKKRQIAADRGNNLHKLCEKYVMNQSLDLEVTNPQFKMFLGVRKLIDEHIDDIMGVELPVISKTLGVAGTLDLLGHFKNKLSIIDWKNTNSRTSSVDKKLPKYYLQSTIYAMIVEEQFGLKVEQVVVVFGYVKDEAQAFVMPINQAMKDSVVNLIKRFNLEQKEALEQTVLF